METLAPRELYDRDELGMWRRLPIYGAVIFAAGTFFISLIPASSRGEPIASVLLVALITSIVGGIAWALLFTWLFRRFGKTLNDQWYFADPRMVASEPAGYEYRLPCTWVPSNASARAGVLYLGSEGLRFDPSVRLAREVRGPLIIAPLNRVDVDVVDVTLPFRARIWGHRTIPRIRIRWNGHRAEFGLPGAREIGGRLRDKVIALQERPPVTKFDRSPA